MYIFKSELLGNISKDSMSKAVVPQMPYEEIALNLLCLRLLSSVIKYNGICNPKHI